MNAREAAHTMSEIIERDVHERVSRAPSAYEGPVDFLRVGDREVARRDLVSGEFEPGLLAASESEPVTFTPPHCPPHTARRGEWIAITPMRPPPYAVPIIVRAVLSGVPISIPVMADKLGRYRHINRGPLDPGAYLETHCYRVTHWQHYPDPFIPATRYRVMCRRYWHADPPFPAYSTYRPVEGARSLTFQGAQAFVSECRAREVERLANVSCFMTICRNCEFVIEPEGEGAEGRP